jgi:hypothetical protein
MANKYKNKQGKFISREQFIKENFNDLSPENLNAKELIEYSKIVQQEAKERARLEKNAKISEAAKKRIRIKGAFLTKEQEQRTQFELKKLGLEFNQKNVDKVLFKPLFFTSNSQKIAELLTNHKGTITVNGQTVTLSQAIEKFELEHKINCIEYAKNNDIKPQDIFLIIYDLIFNPITKNLELNTNVEDENRVIVSEKKPKKKNAKKR